jgi:hypothetical protein
MSIGFAVGRPSGGNDFAPDMNRLYYGWAPVALERPFSLRPKIIKTL